MAQETVVYRELARIVLAEQPLAATLTRIAELTRVAVDGADDVSVTLIQGGKPRSVAFSEESKVVVALDERQYEDGFGPCLDAALSGLTIAIEDTSVPNELYPKFAVLADREGVRHTLSVGLPTIYDITGALNLYGRGDAGPFSPDAVDVAVGFGGYAAVALTNAALYTGALELADQMQQAMTSRAVIEQAKGVVMHAEGCTADEAFLRLRRTSSRSNTKLHDVARQIVEGARRP